MGTSMQLRTFVLSTLAAFAVLAAPAPAPAAEAVQSLSVESGHSLLLYDSGPLSGGRRRRPHRGRSAHRNRSARPQREGAGPNDSLRLGERSPRRLRSDRYRTDHDDLADMLRTSITVPGIDVVRVPGFGRTAGHGRGRRAVQSGRRSTHAVCGLREEVELHDRQRGHHRASARLSPKRSGGDTGRGQHPRGSGRQGQRHRQRPRARHGNRSGHSGPGQGPGRTVSCGGRQADQPHQYRREQRDRREGLRSGSRSHCAEQFGRAAAVGDRFNPDGTLHDRTAELPDRREPCESAAG